MAATLRKWFLVLVLSGSGAALGWLWLFSEKQAQDRVLGTYATLLLTGAALLVWVLALSGWAARARLGILAALALLAGFGWLCLEVRGVTGDFVPIVAWRFAPRPPLAEARPRDPVEPEAAGPAARDWPQFLGPDRDGTLRGVGLERDWAAHPPRLLWRRPVGSAWSGFAVGAGLAVTQEQRGELECVVAYDLAGGEPRWIWSAAARFESVVAGNGPRATPAIAGDKVFALGATGTLACLDLASGNAEWSRDVLRDAGAENLGWGLASSPLVTGSTVIVGAGAGGPTLLAYDAESGERVWAAGHDVAGFSSPQVATLAGVPQLLAFNAGSVSAHDLEDGHLLWEVPWSDRNPNVAQPRVLDGDRVLVSSGYGVGSTLFEVARSAGDTGGLEARAVWRSRALKAKFANFVDREGFVYGLDDGILACLDAKDGERAWKSGRYGHGQLLLVDDVLLIQAESGAVVLVAATPDAHRELARFDALEGKTWNSPTLAAPYLLVRNDLEAACYELPLAGDPVSR